MGNFEIFTNNVNLLITITCLVLLFLSCTYAAKGVGVNKGVMYIFAGLTIEFVASWFGVKVSEFHASGVSISILVFVELTLLLFAMLFFAVAASQILVNSSPDLGVLLAIAAVGLVANVYFIFISPDGAMVAKMRQIYPIAGFAYMSASFWSKTSQRNNLGYILAAIITSVVTVYLFAKLLGYSNFVSRFWYLNSLTYIILSISLIMMKTDEVTKKLIETQKEVVRYNRRIEEIIKSSPFPIIISRLSDDRIILANTNAIKLFGIEPKEMDRYHLRDFFADSENRRLLNERLEQEREVQDFEILVKTPSGDSPFWLLTSANIIDYNYDIALYAAFQDITSRKNREVLLKNQAIRDPLTSLYNRRYFEEEVFNRILDAKITNDSYSVLMIDADHFKKVNDTFGHKIGDKVLIELSSTCEKALRDVDIVARYGGEEFVIFLADVNAEKAKTVADRLRETISEVVVYSDNNEEVRFTVSIGISSNAISDNIDMLIKTADEALYRAKQNGRNRCEIFHPGDLDTFSNAEQEERKSNETHNHHPIFDKEDNQEISLLDGIEANHIIDEKTKIEEKKDKADDFYPILGVDEEDIK